MPAVIPDDAFEAAQQKLVSNQPTVRPAQVPTNSNLLIGLVTCGCGGDGMVTSTGKGRRYKYYAYSNRARSGKSACKGRRISMGQLDDVVLDALEARLLQPSRLREPLSEWLDHSNKAEEARREKLRQLRTRQTRWTLDSHGSSIWSPRGI